MKNNEADGDEMLRESYGCWTWESKCQEVTGGHSPVFISWIAMDKPRSKCDDSPSRIKSLGEHNSMDGKLAMLSL